MRKSRSENLTNAGDANTAVRSDPSQEYRRALLDGYDQAAIAAVNAVEHGRP